MKKKCFHCGDSDVLLIETREGRMICSLDATSFNYCEICGSTLQKLGDDPDVDQLHFEEECFK